ncbi:MAG: hypothetical protein QF535_19700 [Anaerolineales bacterium]|nr:hypothetical protein [Anaerolineales bacterium]
MLASAQFRQFGKDVEQAEQEFDPSTKNPLPHEVQVVESVHTRQFGKELAQLAQVLPLGKYPELQEVQVEESEQITHSGMAVEQEEHVLDPST